MDITNLLKEYLNKKHSTKSTNYKSFGITNRELLSPLKFKIDCFKSHNTYK